MISSHYMYTTSRTLVQSKFLKKMQLFIFMLLLLNRREHILGLLKVGLLDLVLISGLDDLGQPVLGQLTILWEGIAMKELESEIVGGCR